VFPWISWSLESPAPLRTQAMASSNQHSSQDAFRKLSNRAGMLVSWCGNSPASTQIGLLVSGAKVGLSTEAVVEPTRPRPHLQLQLQARIVVLPPRHPPVLPPRLPPFPLIPPRPQGAAQLLHGWYQLSTGVASRRHTMVSCMKPNGGPWARPQVPPMFGKMYQRVDHQTI